MHVDNLMYKFDCRKASSCEFILISSTFLFFLLLHLSNKLISSEETIAIKFAPTFILFPLSHNVRDICGSKMLLVREEKGEGEEKVSLI